jgi:microcystin-dependent protein
MAQQMARTSLYQTYADVYLWGLERAQGLSAYALGDTGGEETHTLITSETPAHSHTDTGHSHSEIVAAPNVTTIGVGAPEPTAIPGVGVTGIGSASLTSTGGNGAHNNLQPFIALNYFIVALP